ncbi:glycerate kinase [Rhodococcus jostii]|uniref:Glycerate kinase n=1 Tax=Rhodococcus jostii TaxID=132919 RepID=A0ABU4C9I9_RHOJO|nr:glycerate kinase [Rhodococcus jostii]MDV6280139.1 glycerate kinase [Rhodococcus jostii]
MTSTDHPESRKSAPMRVVFAPDSFKGSINAIELADALAAGWAAVRPRDELVLLPQADGGEGTLDAIASCHPHVTWHSVSGVRGPDGRRTTGRWLRLDDGTAVVELAQMSGLPLMNALDAGGASTTGLGQVIAAALDAGAKSLLIGLGGSASTDGGAGALRALGARLLDRHGRDIGDGGAALSELDTIDVAGLRVLPPGGVELLSDTTAVLCGSHGAAHVFGPQKGADPQLRVLLDGALQRFADRLGAVTAVRPDQPGAGAAGGTGFGLAAWGGRLVPGSARIADLTGLSDEFGRADVIVTGEGRFDETSLTGKLVGSVLARCADTNTRSVVVAGQLAATPPDASISLTALAGSAENAIAETERWARHAGTAAAEIF